MILDQYFLNNLKQPVEEIINYIKYLEKRDDFLDLISHVGLFLNKNRYFNIEKIAKFTNIIVLDLINNNVIINPEFIDIEKFNEKIKKFKDKWEND